MDWAGTNGNDDGARERETRGWPAGTSDAGCPFFDANAGRVCADVLLPVVREAREKVHRLRGSRDCRMSAARARPKLNAPRRASIEGDTSTAGLRLTGSPASAPAKFLATRYDPTRARPARHEPRSSAAPTANDPRLPFASPLPRPDFAHDGPRWRPQPRSALPSPWPAKERVADPRLTPTPRRTRTPFRQQKVTRPRTSSSASSADTSDVRRTAWLYCPGTHYPAYSREPPEPGAPQVSQEGYVRPDRAPASFD